ncbi:MAG: hypothetical protein U1E65_15385 [Myxococcota bacterium]
MRRGLAFRLASAAAVGLLGCSAGVVQISDGGVAQDPCPAIAPTNGSACGMRTTVNCLYEQQCCCGQCHPAWVCACTRSGGVWSCSMPDFCPASCGPDASIGDGVVGD